MELHDRIVSGIMTTWRGQEERNRFVREVPRKDGLGHQDNVDGPQGLEGQLKAEQSKTIKQETFYTSSDSDTSSSEEEILAASRTEVEDGSSGEREVVFNINLNLFHLTLLILYFEGCLGRPWHGC